MAKKHGNWLFLCNFVGMKQTLPDYIKQHENFQLALLKLEDGFIKFFVEHSEDEDVNGLVNFEGESVKELTDAFHEAVDDYLAYCEDEAEVAM